MGNMAVVASNSSRINYYWEIYSIMGDPSLIPYMGVPTDNNAQYAPTVQLGVGTMQITADPYTYVAISQNEVLHGVGLTDASGALTLNFIPFTSPGTAKLVLTRSLRKPTIADIQITTSAGPYLLVNDMTVNDGNNSIAESGETFYLDLVVNNVGTQNAQNITATITSSNPYVNIIDGSASLATAQINTPVTINNAFHVAISSAIPDQEMIEFSIQLSDGSTNTWNAIRNLTVNAPNLTFSSPVFFDPNNDGAFSPGEMITISFNLTNTGHMNAGSAVLRIIINSDDATASQNSFTLPGLNVGINIPINLQVTIAPSAQTGTVIPVGLALTAGSQMVNSMVPVLVGVNSIGFEDNVIPSPIINPSTIPWTIVSNEAHLGTHSFKSGAIGHNGMTEIYATLDISVAGDVTFWRKVSSESGYDFLKFFIDTIELGSWSGNLDWAEITYPVSAGQHTFTWRYSKDYSTIGGSDCAWIDDIVFPSSVGNNLPVFYLPVTNLNFTEVDLYTLTTQDFVLRNLGSAPLSGTISVPSVVDLLFNGNPVSDNYNYSIPAGQNGIFTVSLYLTSITVLDEFITITSNDASVPSQQIALHIDTVANDDDNNIPLVTKLEGNYPNPFNPVTTIRFAVKEPGKILINIYNPKGQLVKTLVNDNLKAGNHSTTWNGTDEHGKSVSSGVYLYRMQASGVSQTRKMMLMK